MKNFEQVVLIIDTFEINKVMNLFFKSFQDMALAVIPIVVIEDCAFKATAFDNIDFTITDTYLKNRIEKFIFENKKGKIKKLKHIFETKVKETNECFDLFINNRHYESKKKIELIPYRQLFGLPNESSDNDAIDADRFLMVCALFSYQSEVTTIECFYNSLRQKFDEQVITIKKAFEYESTAFIKQTSPVDFFDNQIVEKNTIIIKEQHGNIFSNNGFVLFEYILNEFIKPQNTAGRYEDLSYYYRCLFEGKFIHQKPEPFRLWFMEEYKEEFSKIKTKIQTTTPQRKKDYSTALDWFNPQNQ